MILTRLNNFEMDLERELAYTRTSEDVLNRFRDLAKWVGQEIDYIEKNMSTAVTVTGKLGTGIVASDRVGVVVGNNLITFDEPLASDKYQVFYFVFDSGKTLIDMMNPDKIKLPTAQNFQYNSPDNGTMLYIAVVTASS